MKYDKSTDGGYIHNCLVHRRENDPTEKLFSVTVDRTIPFLNGYAIIPIEEYAMLTNNTDIDSELSKIETADLELYL